MMKQPIRVLVVEDEVLTAMCLEMELKQAGYDVLRPVATGEEAVLIAQQEPLDLILMDIRLAGEIDGIEAAQQIQTICDTPIIFMTGYPDKETEQRAQALTPLGYLRKPMTIYDLQLRIEAGLHK